MARLSLPDVRGTVRLVTRSVAAAQKGITHSSRFCPCRGYRYIPRFFAAQHALMGRPGIKNVRSDMESAVD